MKVFMLTIYTSVGPPLDVCGSQQAMQEAIDDFENSVSDTVVSGKFSVSGMENSAARNPVTHVVEREVIVCMSLSAIS